MIADQVIRPAALHRRRSVEKAERGYAMIFVAFLILPMVAMVGIAVDVGSFYVRAAHLQKAADAAALAGVIYQPDFERSEDVAIAIAKDNGFDPAADPNIDVVVEGLGGQRLRVVIYDRDADVFFSSIFLSDVEIVRFSTAEFVRPVPLGSPIDSFGNSGVPVDANDPQLWAAIQAPFTRFEDGDPFATGCLTVPNPKSPQAGTQCDDGDTNPDYRPEGFWYAVEVTADQVNRPVSVDLFDAGFYQRASVNDEVGDFVFTGAAKPHTGYQLYDRDSTTINHRDNPPLAGCKLEVQAEAGGYKNVWHPLCVFTPTQPGIFPLRVYTSNSAFGSFDPAWGPSQGQGFNGYAVRAVCGSCDPLAPKPRIYGIGDISILNNALGGTSEFFLAEIDESNDGKILEIRMFDPGDGAAGKFTLSVIEPDGAIQQVCDLKGAGVDITVTDGCSVVTRDPALGNPNIFNGEWLEIQVPLTSYTCSPDPAKGCWWKIRYEFADSASPTDRTVWQVRVIGDPVRLVPS